jgi:small subunit ribosomal protein S9
MPRIKRINYTYAVGRRKSASARVRLHKGDKESTVNNIVIGKYFNISKYESLWKKPFEVTDTLGRYFITAKVQGGGKRGQLEAVTHGIARAFARLNPEKYRKLLKKEGLLKRDSRIRERRKVGMGGKSRRKKQSPKR